jgi:glucose-6-phosphate dehydrogenase assembly protein OpcA
MEMENQMNSASGGSMIAVNPKAIEQELARLRRESTSQLLQPADYPPARTTVINLVAYASGPPLIRRVTSVVDEMVGRYPSRAILLLASPEAVTPSLNAQVSVHCGLQGAEKRQVCFERVLLSATGPAIHQMTGLALSLLVPDLPVFLWWPGQPAFQGDTFDLLVDSSDRLIVDSADFTLPGALASLASLVTSRHPECALGDLNWSRLTLWREMVAQFFDAPNLLSYLTHLDKAIIEYEVGKRAAGLPQALLLVGWLASRLGWKPAAEVPRVEGQDFTLEMSRAGSPIAIEIRASSSQGRGGLVSARLMATRPEPSATFVVARAEDEGCAEATIEIEGAKPVTRVVCVEPLSEGQLLSGEMELSGHDRVYEETLRVAGFLAGRLAEARGR